MQSIDEKLKILRPILGPRRADALRRVYFMEESEQARSVVENEIDTLITRLAKKGIDNTILLPPPQPAACKGDIDLGQVEYLDRQFFPYNLNLRDINRHAGIFGSTGTGKTTLASNIIAELFKFGIPTIIIDWETSYRYLARSLPGFIVYTVGIDIHPFYINLFDIPPGITSSEYAKNLITIISNDYLGGQGSDTVLLEYILETFAMNDNPSFADLSRIIDREIVQKLKIRGKLGGRSGLWKETVLRQNKFMSTGCISNVINTNRTVPIESLLGNSAVFELGNLQSPHDRAFISHFLLNQLLLHLKAKGIETEQLKMVIVMEEFHNLVSIEEKRKDSPFMLIDTLFREIRKYGVGLIAIDQTPSEIPNAVYQNMNTKISFSLNTNNDTYAMGRAMNMPEHQWNYLGMLGTGKAIVSVKQRVPEPFLLSVAFNNPPGNVGDKELEALMNGVSDLSTEIYPQDFAVTYPQPPQQKESPPSIGALEKLEPLEKVMLSDILENPFDGVDARTKRLAVHQSEMKKIHASMTKKAIILPVQIEGKKLFDLTPYGKDLATTNGLRLWSWKGGLHHAFAVDKVVSHLKTLGFSPKAEVDNIDIVDADAGIGIEVETGKSHIVKNIEKLVNAKLKYRYMLGVDTEAKFKIEDLASLVKEIIVMSVKDFTKLTKDRILTTQTNLTRNFG